MRFSSVARRLYDTLIVHNPPCRILLPDTPSLDLLFQRELRVSLLYVPMCLLTVSVCVCEVPWGFDVSCCVSGPEGALPEDKYTSCAPRPTPPCHCVMMTGKPLQTSSLRLALEPAIPSLNPNLASRELVGAELFSQDGIRHKDTYVLAVLYPRRLLLGAKRLTSFQLVQPATRPETRPRLGGPQQEIGGLSSSSVPPSSFLLPALHPRTRAPLTQADRSRPEH